MHQKLMTEAIKARNLAYAPYSGFRVGAALLGGDKIYTGSNIENISFGATCCAERVAIFKAVSEGIRDLKAIAVVSDSKNSTFPCGICLQVMAEFSIQKIIVSDGRGGYREYTLDQLLPCVFDDINRS
ncbi:MAG: cytidine deaminase [Clostridiales bacterium]|jgi:cytidine deaminase|nr:cytidine deaminase [Clostridiales bacterium]